MSNDRKEAYLKKLRDPRWQKKRLQILSRDGWACQSCGDTETTLNVHHKYYKKNADPWDYLDEPLVTLCEICHEEETTGRQQYDAELITAFRKHFLNGAMETLAMGAAQMRAHTVNEVLASLIAHVMQNEDAQRQALDQYFEFLKKRRERLELGQNDHEESED
jgi:cytochrome c553